MLILSVYICKKCGNKRWFYHDVTVVGKRLIDLKEGKENNKIFGVNKDLVDNDEFELIYCKKCDNKVSDKPLH